MTARTYALQHPIKIMVGDVEELTREVEIRRPTAGDFRAVDEEKGGDVAKSLVMIGRLTGLMGLQVDRLDGVDMLAINAVIEGFIEPGPPTGGTSSAT